MVFRHKCHIPGSAPAAIQAVIPSHPIPPYHELHIDSELIISLGMAYADNELFTLADHRNTGSEDQASKVRRCRRGKKLRDASIRLDSRALQAWTLSMRGFGWAACFKYGLGSFCFSKVSQYLPTCLATG